MTENKETSNKTIMSFDGFYVCPFSLSDCMACHYMYVKEELGSGGERIGKLFVVNIGNLTESNLQELFKECGEIGSIDVGHLENSSCRVAYIQFVDKKSVSSLLKQIKSGLFGMSPFPKEECGINILEKHLNQCHKQYANTRSELRETAEGVLTAYNEEQEKLVNETDEDGWTVVRRRQRVDEEEMLSALQVRMKKQKESEMKKDFYRFQNRESKRDKLRELREQFDRDKQRIEKMKQNRKFKPV